MASCLLWYIQVPRYEEARRAFENDFLNLVVRPLDGARALQVQRSLCGGQAPDHLQEGIPRAEFRSHDLLRRLQCGGLGAVSRNLLHRNPLQIGTQHLGRVDRPKHRRGGEEKQGSGHRNS
jgi:hypothetical protein